MTGTWRAVSGLGCELNLRISLPKSENPWRNDKAPTPLAMNTCGRDNNTLGEVCDCGGQKLCWSSYPVPGPRFKVYGVWFAVRKGLGSGFDPVLDQALQVNRSREGSRFWVAAYNCR